MAQSKITSETKSLTGGKGSRTSHHVSPIGALTPEPGRVNLMDIINDPELTGSTFQLSGDELVIECESKMYLFPCSGLVRYLKNKAV